MGMPLLSKSDKSKYVSSLTIVCAKIWTLIIFIYTFIYQLSHPSGNNSYIYI